MRKVLFLTVLLCAYALQAQVGVNTTDPQAQLDISTGITPSEKDGLLIPRLDEFPAGVTANQDGMLVFMTGDGAPSKGFYYWNHGATNWVAITGSGGGTLDQAYDFGGAGAGNSINATDGALTITGEDGFSVTGTIDNGDLIAVSGAGTRMFFNPRRAAFRAGVVDGAQWDATNLGYRSFATNQNTRAIGNASAAFGTNTTAQGPNSIAGGFNTTASGSLSIALGLNSIASEEASFAMGQNANANGDYSFAFGRDVTAQFQYGIALGRDVTSTIYAFATGEELTASGRGSVAFGQGNIASGIFASTFGRNNTAPSFGEMVIGLNATEYIPAAPISYNINDKIFVIGNGTATTARSNALTIYKSGLMNINDEYNMPLSDGTIGQVMTSDGAGNVTFQHPAAITDTDNQQIDVLNLNGTELEISLQDDGVATQTLDLSSLGLDNQQIDVLNLNGTNLEISLQNDGIATQTLDLSSLQDGTGTDNQTIDFFGLSGTNLLLSLENDGEATQSIDLGSLSSDDADWYAANTTNNASSINQSIYTNGFVGIGESNPAGPLNIVHNGPETIVANIDATKSVGGGIYEGLRIWNSSPATVSTSRSINVRNDGGRFKYGLDAEAIGPGVINFGVQAEARGATSNFGIVARAFGGINNIAGQFGNNAVPGSGNVRITDELDVSGSLLFRIGSEAIGRVLTSDAMGNATWQDPLVNTDNQNLVTPTLTGTTLNLNIEDGTGTSIDLAAISGGTLDDAYDFGGAGNGNFITATDGAITINGEDGILVTGTTGSGETITPTGPGTRMFFNPRKAAFRAGNVNGVQWNDGNVGFASTAIGESVIASGDYSTAFGRANLASGLYATALGVQTRANAENATAFGFNTTASGETATAYGYENTAPSFVETTIGIYATNYTPTNVSSFNANDRLFTIGNGSNSGARSNALTIYKSGLMNINDEYNMPLTDGTAGQVMTSDGAGNVAFQNNLQESTTANNGLTLNTGTVQLGGALIQNTTITQATRSLDINLNSTGDFAIQDNGTDVFFVEDSGDIGIGTSNPQHPLHLVENTVNDLEGIYVDKNDNSAGETNGIYVEKSGGGTGRSHAIRTRNDGAGTGQKYGLFNTITATSAGTQYGVRNFLSATTTAWQFGTFNNLDNGATGNQYGVYNGMRGANAANLYGVYNEFERAYSSPDDLVGVRTRFTGGIPGTNGMSGVWTDFTTSANGNYYGIRNQYSASTTGTGNKYGSYNIIPSGAGGTHYGMYSSVATANGWANYLLGKSFISQRLSIGETDNADGRLSILNNSGGANPAHIQLTETTANDGPRIQFANTAETTNEWTLFGRADNTLSDSQFNIFHTGTGNVLQVKGDGNVGVTGNPDTDFHVFHGNSGSTSGMKLQNTTDNTWWRFYVSSGSDDLRIYNSNNGATIMGAFNDATGAYTATSDRRLKKDFKDLYFSWDNFMAMQPLTYKYKQDNKPTTYIGMVAQDVENVYPELVTYHEDNDIYHMDYSATGIVAIKAVQELKKEVATLASENENLKRKLAKYESLEARLSALEKNETKEASIIKISEEK